MNPPFFFFFGEKKLKKNGMNCCPAHATHRVARCELDRRRRDRGRAAVRWARNFVKVRSTRAPQPGLLRREADGVCVERPTAKTAFRPARPAFSMTRRRGRRACSAADSSRARRPVSEAMRRGERSLAAARRFIKKQDRGGVSGRTSTGARSRRRMRAGRRSMTWCSARSSIAGARLRSPRPSGSAGAFSKSASAPASRCRIMRAPIG